AFDVERHAAFALEPPQAEQLSEACFKIHVGELQLRFHLDALIGFGERHRAFDYAAIGLRLADSNDQVPAAQIGRYRGAAELGIGYDDVRGREPQIDIETGKSLERDAAVAPRAFVGGQQADGRHIRTEVERVSREGALQSLTSVSGKREHAFGSVAVEFDIDARQANCSGDHVGPRLDCETAEAAAGRRLLAGPYQRIAQ